MAQTAPRGQLAKGRKASSPGCGNVGWDLCWKPQHWTPELSLALSLPLSVLSPYLFSLRPLCLCLCFLAQSLGV